MSRYGEGVGEAAVSGWLGSLCIAQSPVEVQPTGDTDVKLVVSVH